MKFTLKDYQEDAVHDVLKNFRKARRRWMEDRDKHAFSLTAPTGAGKTVMAAAALEALFHGNDSYDFDADPGAVVVWFSDDPSLNEQTRFRLMECADRLPHSNLVVIENTFNRERFEAGQIYFLNTQKLGRNSLLVRGFDVEQDGVVFPEIRPDLHSFTIWDTIRNTIEDPDLRLCLFLDEAHRGMGNTGTAFQNERSTIIKRLINGDRGIQGIPIVLGISATVARFNRAMEGAQGRTILPNVVVDATRVRESGLLKDTIALDLPHDAHRFDSILVRRAAAKLRDSSTQWVRYAREQGPESSVVPLMVLQVPNTPNLSDIGQALDTIFEEWSALPENCVANVFGEHTAQMFGRHSVPYVSPERVQDETWIRILIAKDAISTGWDCPRAEVMVSFRPSKDHTQITQLLGRMVRTPLARRIPGSDRLNSVDCLLPFFDEPTVKTVVNALMHGNGDVPPLGRVLINPKEMEPNAAVTPAIWDKFVSLPSQTCPQRGAKPPVRLTALAQELVLDGILSGAGAKAHSAMHEVLDSYITARSLDFEDKHRALLTVEGKTVVGDMQNLRTQISFFLADADTAVVNEAFRHAARILSPDIARTYAELRARRKPGAAEDFEDALIEAREDIGALGLMENLQNVFDEAATRLSDAWLIKYKDAIKALPDERQEAYRQVTALSRQPQDIDLARPTSRIEATSARAADGTESRLSTYRDHLLCDEDGLYPVQLNDWETAVLKTELQRTGFKFWYRNPDRPSQDSFGIAYQDGSNVKVMRPDFLFFTQLPDGDIVADIVDPHGAQFADALPKLRGLAQYAETHSNAFRRIEAVAEVSGRLRVLDMTASGTRSAVAGANNASDLYSSALAKDYG